MENKQGSIHETLQARRIRAEYLRDQNIKKAHEEHPQLADLDQDIHQTGMLWMGVGLDPSKQEESQALQRRLNRLEERRESYMQEHGISEEIYQPVYSCSDCQDTGFVNGQSCHCREQLKMERAYDMSSIRQQLDDQNFDQFDLSLFRKDRRPDEPLSPYENMLEIKELFEQDYIPYFNQNTPNVYLFGPPGVGKTFLSSAIAKELMDQKKTVLYQSANDLLDFLTEYSFLYEEQRKEYRDSYQYVFDSDLLIIDDLGTEFTNDKIISELFRLINSRLLQKKPMIISSNLKPSELSGRYGQRIASRVEGQFVFMELFGSDLRRRL